MTKQLELGDILHISDSKRMVYVGDGVATMELYYPKNNEWKQAIMPLTKQQIAFWLSKK